MCYRFLQGDFHPAGRSDWLIIWEIYSPTAQRCRLKLLAMSASDDDHVVERKESTDSMDRRSEHDGQQSK